MRKIFLTLYIALIFVTGALGQQGMATVHLDKPYYVTGEIAFYKIYLPSEFSQASGKLMAIVRNSQNNIVSQFFVELEEGSIESYFKIPYDVSTDLMRISFYGLENKVLNVLKLFDFEFPVYNDLAEGGLAPVFPDFYEKKYQLEENQGDVQLLISTDKKNYNLREAMEVTAFTQKRDGTVVPSEISISIVDEGLVGDAARRHSVFQVPIELAPNKVLGLDERTFLRGELQDAATGAPAKVSIIGAYSSGENKMHYAKSANDGSFTLLLPDQYGEQNLQVAGYLYDELEDSQFTIDFGPHTASTGPKTNAFDDDIANYMTSSNMRKRIYQHFNQIENSAQFTLAETKKTTVRPNKTFKIKESVSCETVGKFFDEILNTQLDFEKKGDVITARMYNPEANRNTSRNAEEYYFSRSPVFIVDGKMTKDASFIYNMKLDFVQEIDIYYDWRDITKQYGTFGDFGYVIVRTSQADIDLPEGDDKDIVKYTGTLPTIDYPVVEQNDDPDLPVLKPQSYWNPSLSAKNLRDGRFTARTTDDSSQFRIVATAQTSDGTVVTSSYSFNTGGSE